MFFKMRLQRPSTLIRLGALFLLVGSLLQSPWLKHWRAGTSVDVTDFLLGLFYALAIGFFLMGVWRKSRQDAHHV